MTGLRVELKAYEYQADGALVLARFAYEGSAEFGWTVTRDGDPVLSLGPGYRLLRSERCGVCSTDLARRYLPFPLPQITGHEVVARNDSGQRFAVEINAPPVSRGIESACPFCRLMPNHCPDRLVLGIHDLPGGFAPYILAPVDGLHAIPDSIDNDAAVLIEPLAAALHAVDVVAPREGQRIAVLGPRKLGMLVVAALAAKRRQGETRYQIVALARRRDLLDLALTVGADEALAVAGDEPEPQPCDIVIDCTGSPEGLELATRTARAEVHLKSTHGRPAGGLRHPTELVVDELSIERFDPGHLPPSLVGSRPLVAWMPRGQPPQELAVHGDVLGISSCAKLLEQLEAAPPSGGLPRVDAAVVDSICGIESAIRPFENRQSSLVRPRGAILLAEPSPEDLAASSLVRAVWERGLRLSSSRCGDFAAAIALLESDARLRAVAPLLITHRFSSAQVPEAFDAAASRDSIKAVVEHEVRS